MSKSLIPQSKMGLQRATSIVPYLTPAEVYQMAEAAAESRNGERDKLLISLLFETGLRVSEALSLTPRLIGQSEGKPVIYLKKGKGSKARMVACPEELAHRIRVGSSKRTKTNDLNFSKCTMELLKPYSVCI